MRKQVSQSYSGCESEGDVESESDDVRVMCTIRSTLGTM